MKNSHVVDQIKNFITMFDVCEKYGIKPNRSNFICCPFHSEKTPSMKIYNGDRGYYCFGCGTSGDVIKFTQQYFSLSFFDAISKINDDFFLGLPIGERIDKRQEVYIAKQVFLKKKEQKKKEKEHEKYLTAWLDAHGEFLRLERQRSKYKPNINGSELRPEFIDALKNIEYAKYKLRCAEDDLYNYEKSNG